MNDVTKIGSSWFPLGEKIIFLFLSQGKNIFSTKLAYNQQSNHKAPSKNIFLKIKIKHVIKSWGSKYELASTVKFIRQPSINSFIDYSLDICHYFIS